MTGQDLIYAILGGDTEKVRRLLDAGADPNEVTTWPWERMTPLGALASSLEAGPDIFSLLLAAGLHLFRDERHRQEWASLSPAEMLERIRLSDVDADEGVGSMAAGFFQSIFRNQFEEVQRYLDLGLDPNLIDGEGDPALHSAQTPEMIRLLVEAGAEIEGRDTYGQTTLGRACTETNRDVALILIDLGADVNATHDHGYSVLMSAAGAIEQDSEVVRILLEHGADARHVSEYGHNPLHEWVSDYDSGVRNSEREEVARLLVQAGTSLDARTHRGFTPLNLALLDGRDDDALCLLRLGADPNADVVPESNEAIIHAVPPLFLVLRYPHVVAALLEAGADPRATDDEGRTALDHARADLTKPEAPTDAIEQSIALLRKATA